MFMAHNSGSTAYGHRRGSVGQPAPDNRTGPIVVDTNEWTQIVAIAAQLGRALAYQREISLPKGIQRE